MYRCKPVLAGVLLLVVALVSCAPRDAEQADLSASVASPPIPQPSLVINEVMSSNTRFLYDRQGNTSDWIELRNTGRRPLRIGGWGLSDSEKNPFKFTFPDIVVPPLSLVLVRASGMEITDGIELHAPFRLQSGGEKIRLSDKNGVLIDSLRIPPLETNASYGRPHSDPGRFDLLSEATPGAMNADYLSGDERVPALTANTRTGRVSAGSMLTLACDHPEAEIRYTLDGSVPDLFSPLWPGSLALDPSLIPDESLTAVEGITEQYESPGIIGERALVVRARAFVPGLKPSSCFTGTYFFESDALERSMPVMLLTLPAGSLMNRDSGIYVLGRVYADWRANNPDAHYQGDSPANYNRRGGAWRVPVAAEFVDGGSGFSVDGELKLMGGWSRASAQKSFQLFFHRKADDSGALEYELFPGLLSRDGSGRPVRSFRSVLLRNGGNDWPITLFRDLMIGRLVSLFPVDVQAGRPVIVYVNGEYWGILNMREAFDEGYFSAHYGSDPGRVRMLEGKDPTGTELRLGSERDLRAYNSLRDAISRADFSSQETYDRFDRQMDLRNHALYTAIQTWTANGDWPGNNIRYWRYDGVRPSDVAAGVKTSLDGRFRWLLYDLEFSMNIYNPNQFRVNMFEVLNTPDAPGWPNPPWSTVLWRAFLKSPEYRRHLVNAACDLTSSVFTPQAIARAVDEMIALYNPEMDAHWQRWNWAASGSRENWLARTEVLKEYPVYRTPEFHHHLRNFFILPRSVPVVVEVPEGGTVEFNYLRLRGETFTGSYYPGIPVDMRALPDDGYRFTGWQAIPPDRSWNEGPDESGRLFSPEDRLRLDPKQGIRLKARFERISRD